MKANAGKITLKTLWATIYAGWNKFVAEIDKGVTIVIAWVKKYMKDVFIISAVLAGIGLR